MCSGQIFLSQIQILRLHIFNSKSFSRPLVLIKRSLVGVSRLLEDISIWFTGGLHCYIATELISLLQWLSPYFKFAAKIFVCSICFHKFIILEFIFVVLKFRLCVQQIFKILCKVLFLSKLNTIRLKLKDHIFYHITQIYVKICMHHIMLILYSTFSINTYEGNLLQVWNFHNCLMIFYICVWICDQCI